MSVPDEIELKLEVPADCLETLARVEGLAAERGAVRPQMSVYFDTPKQDLRSAGLSLRIRHIGERRIQTMKSEGTAGAGLFARKEWEHEIEGDVPELDSATAALTTHLAGKRLVALRPAFTNDIMRTSWEVERDGARIEVVLDAGEIRAGDGTLAVSELELELIEGEPAALFLLAREIADAVPVRLGVASKSERGYLLLDRAGTKAVKAAPVVLDRDMPAASAFQTIAQACIRQFRINEDLLLATHDAAPLHQARVALRRLRSAFSLFKPVVADGRFEHLRQELRWLAGALGEVRNLDVLIQRTTDAAIGTTLRDARKRSFAAACDALESPRTRRLLLDLAEWISVGDWLDADQPKERRVERYAEDMLDRYRRRLKRRGADLASIDEESRHEVRILGKKLRYAAEFFSSLYDGKKATRRRKHFLDALEALQTHLGDLNDEVTGRAVLVSLGIPPEQAAAALGAAIDRAALLQSAEEAYDELIDARRFWR